MRRRLPGGATLGGGDKRLVACRPRAAVLVRTSKLKIFISYRREDSEHVTGRIDDFLAARFGRDHVFMDINIRAGDDFRHRLVEAVGQCDVLLAIIGEQWADIRHREGPQQGQRRLDDPEDYVRFEIQAALTRNIRVIPVLVGQARMPRAEDLPDVLNPLTYRQAAEVRHGRDFRGDVNQLIEEIASWWNRILRGGT